jgi:hypothetical protein
MRTTIDIDPALLEQLRLEAVRRGTTVKALLNSALRAGLAARVAEPHTAYEVDTVSLGAPRMDLDRALQLADALEDEEHRRDLQLRK